MQKTKGKKSLQLIRKRVTASDWEWQARASCHFQSLRWKSLPRANVFASLSHLVSILKMESQHKRHECALKSIYLQVHTSISRCNICVRILINPSVSQPYFFSSEFLHNIFRWTCALKALPLIRWDLTWVFIVNFLCKFLLTSSLRTDTDFKCFPIIHLRSRKRFWFVMSNSTPFLCFSRFVQLLQDLIWNVSFVLRKRKLFLYSSN